MVFKDTYILLKNNLCATICVLLTISEKFHHIIIHDCSSSHVSDVAGGSCKAL